MFKIHPLFTGEQYFCRIWKQFLICSDLGEKFKSKCSNIEADRSAWRIWRGGGFLAAFLSSFLSLKILSRITSSAGAAWLAIEMTPAVSLFLLLQGRCTEHLQDRLRICYYCQKRLKRETYQEKHFTFSCTKTAKVYINFTHIHDSLQKDFWLCPNGFVFFVFRAEDEYNDPHKDHR